MTKFKAGDKVKNVNETPASWYGSDGPKLGEVYTVSRAYMGKYGDEYIVLKEFEAAYPTHSRSAGRYELAKTNKFQVSEVREPVGDIRYFLSSIVGPNPEFDTEADALNYINENGRDGAVYEVFEMAPRAKLQVKTRRETVPV